MNTAKGAKGSQGEETSEPGPRLDDLAHRVIGAAIEVHRHLGPGFAESVYEEALAIEFSLRGIPFVRQHAVAVFYKGNPVGEGRPDFIVGAVLVVEIKAVQAILPVHEAQVISYLRAKDTRLGLLLNFRNSMMRRGIRRVAYGSAARLSETQHNANNVDESHEAAACLVVPSCDSPVSFQVVKEDLDPIS